MTKQKEMSGLQPDEKKVNVKSAINIFELDDGNVALSEEVNIDGKDFKLSEMRPGAVMLLLEKAKFAVLNNEEKMKRD